MKINQNMLLNDGKFGQNNNQPPITNKFNYQQTPELQINPQMFYNGLYGGQNDDEYEEDSQQQ